MKITCSKSELRKFKARAGRRYPQEYIETLWGLRDGWRGCDVLLIKVVPQKLVPACHGAILARNLA